MVSDFLKIFLFFSIVFTGCEKESEPEPKPLPDSRYPTTFLPLTAKDWNAKNTEFQKINIYQGLALNEYGFVEGEIPVNIKDHFNVSFVQNTVEALVAHYKSYMGISLNSTYYIPQDLYMEIFSDKFPNFSLKDQFAELESNNSPVYQGNKFKIFMPQKKIGNQDIYYLIPSIMFNFKENEGLLQIKGNWFPEVVLPGNTIIKSDEAISIANKAIFEKTGIDIIKSNYRYACSTLTFTNFGSSKIEIRECWWFDASPLCMLFIDNQTGEIVSFKDNIGNKILSRFLEID